MNFNTKAAVVVTGGTGALGRVIVSKFLAEGFRIAIPVIEAPETLTNLPESWASRKDNLFFGQANLSREQDVASFISAASKKFSAPLIVINTAGGYAGGNPVEAIESSEWSLMLEGNLQSAFLVCKLTLGGMKKEKFGRIISIAAMPAVLASKNRAAYAIAKRGVVTLTESIAEETKGLGITANAIAPSIMMTPANVQSMPGADTSLWVTPEEVASLALFLASNEARSISGNTVKIFGGV